MALAGRSSRRDGGRRLLVAGMVLTVLIVFFDLSVKSRSPSTKPQLASSAWVDRVLPIIQQSSTEGATFERIRSLPLDQVSGSSITNQANQAAAGAASAYRRLKAVRAPSQVAGPAGLLSASLLVRSQAAELVAAAYRQAFSSSADDLDGPVGTMATAGQDFAVGDQAYALFAKELPSLTKVKAPRSVWLVHPGNYQSSDLQTYLSGVVNAASGQPVNQITIAQVNLSPSPLNTSGGVLLLLPTHDVNFSVVVANTGTEAEDQITVNVDISPSAGNAQFSQRISLPPGAAYNYQAGPLNPKEGAVTTLSVSIVPPSGSPLTVPTKTIQFQASTPQGAPESSTTTSVPPGG